MVWYANDQEKTLTQYAGGREVNAEEAIALFYLRMYDVEEGHKTAFGNLVKLKSIRRNLNLLRGCNKSCLKQSNKN